MGDTLNLVWGVEPKLEMCNKLLQSREEEVDILDSRDSLGKGMETGAWGLV